MFEHHRARRALALGLILVFSANASGCATIINGTKQTVTFNSNPDGAMFEAGGIETRTPALIKLSRYHSYDVKFEKECFEDAHRPIERGISGWFWAGLILWGVVELISLPTGGAFELSPEHVYVELEAEPQACAEPDVELTPPHS